MRTIKEVETTLEAIKDMSISETENYINEAIENFTKTKSIKYYLQGLILCIDNEIKEIIENYSSLKFKDQKEQLTYLKDILRKERKIKCIYKKYKNIKNTKIVNTIEPEYDYTNFNIHLDKTDTKDVIAILKDMIKNGNYDLNKGKLITYVSYLCTTFLENLNNKNYSNDISSILDTLKVRINNYPIESEQRTFFKDIYKRFRDIERLYDQKYDPNHREKAYFEILNYYINHENYFVIQELLRRKPEVCNLKHDNKHIIFYILDLYFTNFKKQFKEKVDININYLKELYLLFTRSNGFRISYEEKKEIDKYLNEIVKFAKATIIKEKRMVHALNQIKEMRPINFYQKAYYDDEEISYDHLTYEKQRIINNVSNLSKRYKKEGYNVEPAFVVGNTAYTLISSEKETKLKIHVMNVSPFITENSVMMQHAHRFIVNNDNSDKDFILKGCRYEKNTEYAVITYTLSFYPSGKIKGLDVDKGVINVENKYLNFYVKDNQINEFLDLYNKSLIKNGGEKELDDIYKMNNHFETLLNNLYPSFIKKYRIPFIYYGYTVPDESILLENKNALLKYLTQMDKQEAMDVLNIITSRIDKWHYSVYPIPNAVYDLKLISNLNYIGIENLRMLNQFYFNSYLVDQKRMEQNKKICYQNLDELVKEFNSYINYVDIENIKYCGKILRKKQF